MPNEFKFCDCCKGNIVEVLKNNKVNFYNNVADMMIRVIERTVNTTDTVEKKNVKNM